ncbi:MULTISPECIES: 6-phosphogluconolactonase [Thiomicrorhabdus]|uniref:6-phosphogluconolactonase n=1 Tax=Thiomicrorhabdus heinhorstiae TaxID=2748010 RepID=A0ABS0BXN3_9GAMM|nr:MULTISPECIES: 6-phosphogluconolactonase [Thiomicrorhabdus]MBF6057764.1 6-phosphogluconolactonase [Thiomicrorhabdus heinhorstiae]
MQLPEDWRCFEDAELLAQTAKEYICSAAEKAIRENGAFHLVTAGGTTPNRIYQLLGESERDDWQFWHIYMGDERCLPLDDPERNRTPLKEMWLDKCSVPSSQIHYMATELGAEAALEDYQTRLLSVPVFDLVMLGMGEDGHTASLFPGHSYAEGCDLLIERDSPKPPPLRLTLSAERLSASCEVLKLITGAGKQPALKAWLEGENLPISWISAKETHQVWIDLAARPD